MHKYAYGGVVEGVSIVGAIEGVCVAFQGVCLGMAIASHERISKLMWSKLN